MTILNIYDPQTTASVLARLENLKYDTVPQWGKMNAPQVLAHLNVSYDLAYGRKENKANFLMKFILKAFIKPIVVGEKPYAKNSGTAPVFVISDNRDFEAEKAKFIDNIKITEQNGAKYFEGKFNASFGVMSAKEWNNMFYKHIDHHFTQFGI